MKEKNTKKTNNDLSALDVILICISYTLAGAYIPITTEFISNPIALSAIALGIFVISVLVLARLARTFKAIIGYAIILGALTLLGGNIVLTGYAAAFILAASSLAYLILRSGSPFAYFLPVAPLIAVAVATRSIEGSLISLFALPAAIALAFSVKNRLSRVSAICRISLGICLMIIAVLAASVYTAYGSLSLTAIRNFIEAFRLQLKTTSADVISELSAMIEQSISEDYVNKLLDEIITTVFNLLPAIIITVSNVAAYVLHATFITVCYPDDKKKSELEPMLSFDMSIVSAIVYLLSVITALIFTSGKTAIAGAVAENAILILAPGLILTALAGIRAIMAKKGPSCLGTLIYFGIIFMLASLSPIAIICVATVGAVLLIISRITEYKNSKNGNQSNYNGKD